MLGPVPIEPPANLPPVVKPATTASLPTPAGAPTPANAPKPISSTLSVLEHTGIPRSVLTWKPRLPSRNWSIFLSIVIGSGSLYYYDRTECARLKREYKEKVEHLAQEKMGHTLEYPRLVKVYAGKWPEDDDYDRGLLYFRRYVKPVLIAAGVDYELITSPQYGALSRHLLSQINLTRRRALGLEPPSNAGLMPYQLNPEQEAAREVRGGVVLVGRHSLKEYLEGLRRGWMDGQGTIGVRKFDMEGQLKAQFEEEEQTGAGPFKVAMGNTMEESGPEFLEEQAMQSLGAGQDAPSASTAAQTSSSKPKSLSSLSFLSRSTAPPPLQSSMFPTSIPTDIRNPDDLIPPHLHLPPNPLPPTPPLLLVPWTNHLGFLQLPYMFLGLFNERKLVREGGEAGLRIVLGGIRDFRGRGSARGDEGEFQLSDEQIVSGSSSGSATSALPSDLDFDLPSEAYYKNDFEKLPKRITDAREKYYSTLPARIATARELSTSAREPTKAESSKPPMTEDELKAERLEKELRWTRDLEGWELVKKGSEVKWDERWKGWLKVYGDPVGEVGSDRAASW